jgi:hypothetical protein
MRPPTPHTEYVLEALQPLVDADWKSIRRDGYLELQIDNAAALVAPTPRARMKSGRTERFPCRRADELIVSSLSVEVVRTPSRSGGRLCASAKEGESERDRAYRSLQAFLSRAFRRPASESEIAAYCGLYEAERAREQRSFRHTKRP